MVVKVGVCFLFFAFAFIVSFNPENQNDRITKPKEPSSTFFLPLVGGPMKEHGDPKDATEHEITLLTFLAACLHLNEATLCSCPDIFPSDALVIIREPGFPYSRSQRVLGLSRQIGRAHV